MGGFLQGLGEFAEGGMKGYEFAERMKDKISARKDAEDKKKTFDAYAKAPKVFRKPNALQPEVAPQSNGGAGFNQVAEPSSTPMDYSLGNMGLNYIDGNNNDADVQVTAFKNGGMVRKYAEGGLISMAADPRSFTNNTNMNAGLGGAGLSAVQPQAQPMQPATQPEVQPEQAQQIDQFQTRKGQLKAARDKAIELKNPQLSQDFEEMVFQLNDNELKKRLPMARQMFESTGDFSAYQDAYNQTHDDGYNIDSHTKNQDGSYTLKMRDPNGNVQDMVMNKDQIEGMVYELSDPGKRRSEQIAATKERTSATFKTDEEIRKKNSENQTLSKDQILFSPDGKEIASNRMAGGFDDIKSVTGGYLKQGADGNLVFVSTGGDKKSDFDRYQENPDTWAKFKNAGKDGSATSSASNKDRREGYKFLAESALEAFGTADETTGKRVSNQQVIDITRKGERLMDGNPQLPPHTVIEIAKSGTNSWEIREMPDGSKIKAPGIKYKDQFYSLSLGGNRPADEAKPSPKPAPKPAQAAPVQVPIQKAGLSVMSEATASEAPSAGLETVAIPKPEPVYEKQYQKLGISDLEKEYKRHSGQKGQYAVPERVAYLEKLIKAKKAVEASKSLYRGN